MSEQTTEPITLRAGDSATWTRSLPDYLPADGWVLRYRVLWPAPPSAAFAAVADGDEHRVSLAAATTASWQAGAATLIAWVEKGTDRVTLGTSALQVLPDLTTAASFDGRTPNQRALAAAKASQTAYLESGRLHVLEYEIDGQRMKFRDGGDIAKEIERLERAVARDNALAAAAQGVASGRVLSRF